MNVLFKILSYYFNGLSWILPKAASNQIFNLFAYPFSARLKPHQQLFLNTSKKFTVIVEDKDVQCYSWGSGTEKVLLIHGWQSNSYRWKNFIDKFNPTLFTIYAFDAPGHGNSHGNICTIPLYEKSIHALIKEKGNIHHLVGHSIGSFACSSYMYHNNYTVRSYVSLASPFSANEFLDNLLDKISLSDRSIECLVEKFKSYTSHPIDHYSLSNFFKEINANKFLIVHDDNDEATPYRNAQEVNTILLDREKNVELKITHGLGHKLNNPSVVKRVVDFICNVD